MSSWGISENATSKEKLKSEMADYLNGLNSTGEISYTVYSESFDFTMSLLDRMYDLGRTSKTVDLTDFSDLEKEVNRKIVEAQRNIWEDKLNE